jgi:hypothetical protein
MNIKFNPSDYYLIPNSIFEDSELESSFYSFLKTELNTEPLEFIQQVKIYKNNNENRRELGIQIFKDFINVGAKKWINIDSDMKDLYEKRLINDNFTLNIFDELEVTIKDELLSDSYRRYSIYLKNRFIRTKKCINLMKKNLGNSNIIISRKQKTYNYTSKDFAYWMITEKDYNFLDEVKKDSHDWIHTHNYKSKDVKANSYYSKSIKNFLPNFKWAENASAYKIDILLSNHTVTSAAKLFYEYRNMNVNLKTKN